MSDYRKQSGGFGGGNRGGGFKGGRPSFGGGRPDFKKGGNRGGRDSGPVEMFTTTCSECGKSCQVPFRPSSDKPVYCNDCFSSKRDMGGNDRSSRSNNFPQKREFSSPSMRPAEKHDNGVNELKKEISSIHAKLDKLMSVIGDRAVASATTVLKSTEKKIDTITKKVSAPVRTEKVAPKKVVKKVVAVTKKKPVSKKK